MAEETYGYGYDASKQSGQDDGSIKIQELVYLCTSKWYWFLVSLVLAFSLAALYILVTQPIYTRQASILIKDDNSNSSLSKEFGQFSDMGLANSNTNLYNEMISLKSPSYMVDVVKKLDLDMNYVVNGTFHDEILYGKSLPVKATLQDVREEENASFTMLLKHNGVVELNDFVKNGEKAKSTTPIIAKVGMITHTPIGRILLTAGQAYVGQQEKPIVVTKSGLSDVTDAYAKRLSVELKDEKASVVDIRIDDTSPQRAEDILNCLFLVYNEKWVEDINKQAISTSNFIDEELRTIERELGSVDENISSYKSKHLVPDVAIASNLYMNKAELTSTKLLELDNQLYIAKYIRHQLTSKRNQNALLPANSGIDNASVSQQIIAYNDKLLQRNKLVANSSANNPLVVELDEGLASTRSAIVSSLDNVIVTVSNQIADLKSSENQTNEKIASNPKQAKYLLSVERQQKVKEQLYLFLLQKREENQLSKAFTAYNTKLLTPPAGKKSPSKPVKINVMIITLVLGLIIPLVLLIILNNLDNKVHSRKDLDTLTIPFLGEIPLSYHRRRGLLSFLNKRKEVREIVVQEKSGNEINEAFRVLRTNLEFVAGKGDGCKTIMFTSANVGSGKTFTTMNLAVSFAIKGKKVMVIDLDLRKASLSTFVKSPAKGFADYLSGHVEKLSQIVVSGTIHPNLDVLPVGTIPPNPTELLFSERLEQTVAELKKQYDYLFIDCPPLEIVADASIVNKLADMTVYVIRAELFDKRLLPDVEKYYQEKRYKNINIILNGTITESGGYGGYHRYGYSYGYRYGYGDKK